MARLHSTRGTSALPLSLIAKAIPKLTRRDLEALTERLIEHLDRIDGDPDLEEDDPQGVHDEDGVNTRVGDPVPEHHLELIPRYGEDQSHGPINEAAAYKDWRRKAYG